MSEQTMPVAEVSSEMETNEIFSYELAFHILPTVAEGEVPAVFEEIKTALTTENASLKEEELPKRFELAYDIVESIEGKNRKFSSAYFGWVRFSSESEAIASITETVQSHPKILRHLLIRLTKAEEVKPFYFHEALQTEGSVEESAEVNEESTEVVTEEIEEKAPEEKSGKTEEEAKD